VDLIDYLKAFRRRWQVLVAGLVLGLVIGWVTSPTEPEAAAGPVSSSYSATAVLVADSPPGTSKTSSGEEETPGINLHVTKLLVTGGEVSRLAGKKIGYAGSPAQLASQVSAAVDDDANALTITVKEPHGERAARVANAFADATIEYVRRSGRKNAQHAAKGLAGRLDELRDRIVSIGQKVRAQPEDPVPAAQRKTLVSQYQSLYANLQALEAERAAPSAPRIFERASPVPTSGGLLAPKGRATRVALGGVLGLLLGAALVLVLERFDTRLRVREDFERVFGLPVVAEVPQLSRPQRRNALLTGEQAATGAGEAYRALRSSLLLAGRQPADVAPDTAADDRLSPPQVVLVVSARPGDGKTTTAANLATALAETGRSALVLDCDFRNPGVAAIFDVPDRRGVSNVLSRKSGTELPDVVRRSGVRGVRVATGGRVQAGPAALLSRSGELIDAARQLADVVIVDSAPLLSANDARDLIPHVDSVVVVGRSGRLGADEARRVRDLLARAKAPTLGIALVAVPTPLRLAPYDYYLGSRRIGRWLPAVRALRRSRTSSGRHRSRDDEVRA
jgi:capsular exopolysaccharide synthesis family protein